MDARPPVLGQHDGIGSWHPAMRPDSSTVHGEEAVAADTEANVTKDDVSIFSTSDEVVSPAIMPSASAISKRNISLQKPLNFHGAEATPLQGEHPPEVQCGPHTELAPSVSHHQGGSHENGVPNGVANHPTSIINDLPPTEAQHAARDLHEGSIDVSGSNEGANGEIDTDPDQFKLSLEARKEMDDAFKSEPDHEDKDYASIFNRTNSFPEIVSLSKPTALPAYMLPKSQAEDIMEEEQISIPNTAPQDTLPPNPDHDDNEFFNRISSAPPDPSFPSPAYEEARYEEGLPLVQSGQPEPVLDSTQSESRPANHFHTDLSQAGQAGIDAAFFENVPDSTEDPFCRPQPPDRKTTTQVLESLHHPFSSAEVVSNISRDDSTLREATEERPSVENRTGGGIVASAHTEASHVLSEQEFRSANVDAKDESLADLWAAALEDDELLDDTAISTDPSAFFEDDGEGFLDEAVEENGSQLQAPVAPPLEPIHESDGNTQGFAKGQQRPTSSGNRYIPAGAAQLQQDNASVFQPSQSLSAPLNTSAAVQQPYPYGNVAPPRPQMPTSTQSFADKSKGGYTSPYDLPMDLTRPKKRSNLQLSGSSGPATQNPTGHPPPPPRSSSMFGGAPRLGQEPSLPLLPSTGSMPLDSSPVPPTLKVKPSAGSFFEELAPKPRPSTSAGKYTPPAPQQASPPPPPAVSRQPLNRNFSADQYSQQAVPAALQAYQLVPPEKTRPFSNTLPQHPPNQAIPAMNTRYSPAPAQPSSVPPPRNRYASSPFGGSQPPSQALPFQPRTSSPLAQSTTIPRQSTNSVDQMPTRAGSDGQQHNALTRSVVPNHSFLEYQGQQLHSSSPEQFSGWSPPIANSRYAPLSDSPPSSSQAINTPSTDRDVPPNNQSSHESSSGDLFSGQQRSPLPRPQTQPPGAAKITQGMPPINQVPYQRPASVNDHNAAMAPHVASPPMSQPAARARGLSQALNYIRPTDARGLDPLERWKGCPIVSFGFGGNVVTTFPQQVPRYAAGQKIPMIKCSPGEVKIHNSKFVELEENTATFPGPLKAKSKKKEVLEWLQKKIAALESDPIPTSNNAILPDRFKCHEEKILLWKTVKILVENDGIVEGNQAAEMTVRAILSPELVQGDAVPLALTNVNAHSTGISRYAGSTGKSEGVDQDAMEELRKILLHGDREKAVWHAVDNRMWAHAMLISSTLDKTAWKQVSTEFVKQEVKAFGNNTESLAALYQIFSGNGEESIDELVPPSARAGLQMVSKVAGTGPTKNALDGLDRWRETLTLILSNRTPEDGRALVSLGQLLAGYGRTEAAHICYIFAKSPGLFGGPDDAQVSVALLGADHLRQPFDYGRDMDSILLTEVYDYARTVLAPSSVATVSPHLQSFKLYHAMVLAEYGYKSEAQQYCDAITSALKSTTKPSPYYHGLLFGALESLTERLRQAPKDGSNSWISKPSIDKVSGSIWAKFNSYVAGDDSDAASTGSGMPGEAEAGPFARVAGGSPDVSRSPSVGDLYGSSGLGLASASVPIPSNMNSRYAPAGVYTPRSSQEQSRQPLHDHLRPQASDTLKPSYTSQQYASRPVSSNGSMNEPHNSHYHPTSYAPQADNYLPTPPSQPESLPEVPPEESLYQQQPYQPTPPLSQFHHVEQSQPPANVQPFSPYNPPSSYEGYEQNSSSYKPPVAISQEPSSYEPPSSLNEQPETSGYEPPSYGSPSYDPDIPQIGESTTQERPKRGMMDEDDDDFEARAATMRKEDRSRKDREADEAMHKAAEEDAKKDNPKLNSKKSGWFGGWLGGAKDKQDSMQQQGNAPIKVKLGEESSFYFDKEKGKWVNKKAGPEDEKSSAPPPPPPRGPPSRAASGTGPPQPTRTTDTPPVPPLPTGTPTPPISVARPPFPSVPSSTFASRSGTPAIEGSATGPAPPTSNLGGAPSTGPSSAPPSRPATSQSGASSIDDLIGAPQQRKGGTVRNKAKKGRGYVDVMAK